jgi:hypothetical protein
MEITIDSVSKELTQVIGRCKNLKDENIPKEDSDQSKSLILKYLQRKIKIIQKLGK